MICIFNLANNRFLKFCFVMLIFLSSSVLYSNTDDKPCGISLQSAVIQGSEGAFFPCVNVTPFLDQGVASKFVFNYTDLLCRKPKVTLKEKCINTLSVCSDVSEGMCDLSSIGYSLFSGAGGFLTGCFSLPRGDLLWNLDNIKIACDSLLFIKKCMTNTKDNIGIINSIADNFVNFCLHGSLIINGFFSVSEVVFEYFLNDSSLCSTSDSLSRWMGTVQWYFLRVHTFFTMAYNLGRLPYACTDLFNIISNIIK